MESKDNPPSPSIFTKPIFILFGIGALLAYNAFLTELPFFIHFLEGLKPAKTIPFLNFALNITFQFLMIWKKNLFKLKFQLILGLILSIIFLILIPIVVANLKKNSFENKFATSLLILIMGFVNALLTSGFYSLASFFPLDNLVALNSGMAIAGILMNVIQYVVLASVNGDSEDDIILSALIFFIISGFILFVCLLLVVFQWNTDYYKYYLRTLREDYQPAKKEELKVELLSVQSNNKNNDNEQNIDENNKQNISENNNIESISGESRTNTEIVAKKGINDISTSISETKKEKTFCEIFKILKDIDLLGMYIYIVTASLYPNAIINQHLYDIDERYNVNTILILINTFDTIGRYMTAKFKATKKLLYFVILSRTVLLFTVLLNYYWENDGKNLKFTGSFLLFNIFALAISNGIGTGLAFGMAPSLVEDENKGQAGASVSFFSTLGTCIGTTLAFGTDEIMEKLNNKKFRK